ncbi:MAG TPA: hypothetical protein VIE68_08370 [Gemmatimonadota bacterium]|jgi:hypothetical protein
MVIAPGQEGIVISITRVSIHGEPYFDVVISETDGPDVPPSRLSARLGPEAIVGDVARGDRVRIHGFLRMVTAIERID